MSAMGTDIIVAGMKNVPFTATESGETVRVLSDGNRETESWTGTMARNSEGRIRRDITSGNAGVGSRPFIVSGSADFAGAGFGAVAGGNLSQVRVAKIDAEMAAQRAVVAPSAGGGVYTVSSSGDSDETKRVVLRAVEAAKAAGSGTWTVDSTAPKAALEAELVAAAAAGKRMDDGRIQTRKESLGSRDFGGVQADGTRVITTIAAGTAGNDRDIEITSETWFSKDLGVVVYSKRSDPRNGETTYQMTNIVRAEPDANLFSPRR